MIYGCINGNLQIVQSLVEHGKADVTILDHVSESNCISGSTNLNDGVYRKEEVHLCTLQ